MTRWSNTSANSRDRQGFIRWQYFQPEFFGISIPCGSGGRCEFIATSENSNVIPSQSQGCKLARPDRTEQPWVSVRKNIPTATRLGYLLAATNPVPSAQQRPQSRGGCFHFGTQPSIQSGQSGGLLLVAGTIRHEREAGGSLLLPRWCTDWFFGGPVFARTNQERRNEIKRIFMTLPAKSSVASPSCNTALMRHGRVSVKLCRILASRI